jgi:1,4-dihydroxy-2-naphthoate polyprenyltransferase
MPLKQDFTLTITGPFPIVGIWIQAFRLHFVPTSILPAMLGSVVSWAGFHDFNFWYFTLVISAVILHHVGLNMIDDVFDYLHAVDRSRGAQKNPYTGGSGVLTTELIPVSQVMTAAVICYLLALVIAIYLTAAVGWPILIFVAIGVFSSVFYTTPPVKYGYRGFGELSLLINFGPVVCLGAFYVQTRSLAWEPFIISLVPGFLMWSMIVINEIPDYEDDRRAGKWNLVARMGRKSGVGLYIAGLICAYGTILLCASLQLTSVNVLWGLITLPMAFKAFRVLNKNYLDKIKMAPANLATINIHALTMICLIAAYIVQAAMS